MEHCPGIITQAITLQQQGLYTSIFMGEMNPRLLQLVVIWSRHQLFTALQHNNSIDTASAPMWQAETAPLQWRGELILLELLSKLDQLRPFVSWTPLWHGNFTQPFSLSLSSSYFHLCCVSQMSRLSHIFFIFTDTYLTCRQILSRGHGVKAVEVLIYLEEKSDNDPSIPTLRSALVCWVYHGCVQRRPARFRYGLMAPPLQ